MKEYPKKVYVSMSWKNTDFPLSKYIMDILIDNNLTVVGDHPEYQKDDPFDRSWVMRIHNLMEDCSALIVILPKKENMQTTSPYMFPEILSASIHKIPILLFHNQGVELKVINTKVGVNLRFGHNNSGEELASIDYIKGKKNLAEIDTILDEITTLRLRTGTSFIGPYMIPGSEDAIRICNDFVEQQVKTVIGKYVFNVLPFSMKDKEHQIIAQSVFHETGLPCKIALDQIGESQDMRKQWEMLLRKSEFVIADLTQIRDACLFEIGVAMGLGKQIFILSNKKDRKLPYGLDNLPLITYDSMPDLKSKVEDRCCKEYKRKVYNFNKDILNARIANNKPTGIPKWYFNDSKSISPMFFHTTYSWIVSISLAAIIWSIFVLNGADDSPLAYVSMMISFVFGLSSSFRQTKQFFESKLLEKIRFLTIGTFTLLLTSIVLIIIAYKH